MEVQICQVYNEFEHYTGEAYYLTIKNDLIFFSFRLRLMEPVGFF